MSETWYLLESGEGQAAANMGMDEALLAAVTSLMHPVLRFYGWIEKAGSFGYSQRCEEIEKITHLRPLVRRPTGGGFVPHDADWTYSVALPPNHAWYQLRAEESYQRIHEWIQASFQLMDVPTELAPVCRKEVPGQCFLGAERHDLLWFGRKIAGAAQRRTKQGLLIQGSVQPPPISLDRSGWHKAMCDAAKQMFDATWMPMKLDEAFSTRVAALVDTKYSLPSWNRKR